ncbi:hypothetical protein DQ403_12765 [Stutzerimonas zhaodongensis]|uniref:Uncharacterized protein n=1 Tax=Stutzerimonas zhaodongensis TaxID=1176257 RepID=A0A365PTU6_9GAMM|nr:hypothetical protein DQ403_12765 [Stutzerimonas zhaodongensis]
MTISGKQGAHSNRRHRPAGLQRTPGGLFDDKFPPVRQLLPERTKTTRTWHGHDARRKFRFEPFKRLILV